MQPETCLREEQLESRAGGVWIAAGLTRPPTPCATKTGLYCITALRYEVVY